MIKTIKINNVKRGEDKMRKHIIKFITTMLFFSTLIVNNSIVHAGPAPQLTDLQIIAVTSDGNNYEWEDIYFNQNWASKPLEGNTAYFAIYVEGTELSGTLRIYSGGQDITKYTTEPLPPDYLSGPDRIVYGKIVYKEIPFGYLNGSINVEARNYYPPNRTFYDYLNFDLIPTGSLINTQTSSVSYDNKEVHVLSEEILKQLTDNLVKKAEEDKKATESREEE